MLTSSYIAKFEKVQKPIFRCHKFGLNLSLILCSINDKKVFIIFVPGAVFDVVYVKERFLRRQSMQNNRNEQNRGQDEDVETPEGGQIGVEHLRGCLKR